MGSVIFQHCISHCNGYSKKNHNVYLKLQKIQQNLEHVATDSHFQAYRQTFKNINQCCSVALIDICCLHSVEMSLLSHNYFIHIYSYVLFFPLWKENQTYSTHCEKTQKLQVPHTMHTRQSSFQFVIIYSTAGF